MNELVHSHAPQQFVIYIHDKILFKIKLSFFYQKSNDGGGGGGVGWWFGWVGGRFSDI